MALYKFDFMLGYLMFQTAECFELEVDPCRRLIGYLTDGGSQSTSWLMAI